MPPADSHCQQVEALVQEFADGVFPKNLPQSVHRSAPSDHRINSEPNHTLPSCLTYRMSYKLEELWTQVTGLACMLRPEVQRASCRCRARNHLLGCGKISSRCQTFVVEAFVTMICQTSKLSCASDRLFWWLRQFPVQHFKIVSEQIVGPALCYYRPCRPKIIVPMFRPYFGETEHKNGTVSGQNGPK